MNSVVQPVSSPYADLYVWKTIQTIASNVVGANLATDGFQVLGDSFFCLMAFLGSTNYDNVAGEAETADIASAIYGPPVVPNFFEVLILQDSNIQLMGKPMPQGCISSSGYRQGRQLAFPILFPPMTRFDFEFYNVSPFLLKEANGSTAVDLRIDFSLYGYNVPVEKLENFMASWPALQRASGSPGWLRLFTAQQIPNLTS